MELLGQQTERQRQCETMRELIPTMPLRGWRVTRSLGHVEIITAHSLSITDSGALVFQNWVINGVAVAPEQRFSRGFAVGQWIEFIDVALSASTSTSH